LARHLEETLAGMSKDAVGGPLNDLINITDGEMLVNHLEAVNNAFNLSAVHGWNRAAPMLAEKFGVDKSAVDAILKANVKLGRGIVPLKGVYKRALTSQAALGGPFFRFNFAPFKLRYVSNRVLPFSHPFQDFSIARRFMAGLSGERKLSKLVMNGAADVEHMQAFWAEGISGVKKYDIIHGTSVARQITGGGAGIPSMFVSASESLGGLTAHFAAHARILRGGGLGAMRTADAARQARLMLEQTSDELLTVVDKAGKEVKPPDFQKRMLGWLNESKGRRGAVGHEQFLSDMYDYFRVMPGMQAKQMRAAAYYEDLRSKVNLAAQEAGKEDTGAVKDAISRLDLRRDAALKFEQQLSEDDFEVLGQIGQSFDQFRATLLDNGFEDA